MYLKEIKNQKEIKIVLRIRPQCEKGIILSEADGKHARMNVVHNFAALRWRDDVK